MMLLDSVFIMELFLRIQEKKPEEHYKDDIILKQTWLSKSVRRDLLLLENQIPLFILNMLYVTLVPDSDMKHEKFIELAYEYFKFFHPFKKSKSYYDEVEKSSSGDHHKHSKDTRLDEELVFEKRKSGHKQLKFSSLFDRESRRRLLVVHRIFDVHILLVRRSSVPFSAGSDSVCFLLCEKLDFSVTEWEKLERDYQRRRLLLGPEDSDRVHYRVGEEKTRLEAIGRHRRHR
ncbi:hypothetical protein K1719_044563 [Acacia pycnantha]|nr:hypothetical protein K1719_044563 [Acacia pycnantha]